MVLSTQKRGRFHILEKRTPSNFLLSFHTLIVATASGLKKRTIEATDRPQLPGFFKSELCDHITSVIPSSYWLLEIYVMMLLMIFKEALQ